MRAFVRRVARRLGYEVTRASDPLPQPRQDPAAPSPDILDRAEYARLVDEYRGHPLSGLPTSVWPVAATPEAHVKDVDPKGFRGDNAFVWQSRGLDAADFVVSALWASTQDRARVLSSAVEDGAFGAECLTIDSRAWSRDLIDSVLEINAIAPLLDACGPRATVVDIGAGYGRLLHRLAEWSPTLSLIGVDGVALSTALARGYLRFRGLAGRVEVLSLTQADAFTGPIDLAINIHSFSEMSRPAVQWWLDWLVERQVHFLFLVPNQPGPRLNDGFDFSEDLAARGFALVRRWSKFDDPVVAPLGIYQAEYLIYERRASGA